MINNLVYKIDKNTNDISNVMTKLAAIENKLSLGSQYDSKPDPEPDANIEQQRKDIDTLKKKITSIESSITTKDRIQLLENTILMKTEDMVKKTVKDKITLERGFIIEDIQKQISEPYDNMSISGEVKNQIDSYFEYFEDKLMKKVKEYMDNNESDTISVAQTDIIKTKNKKGIKKTSLVIDS